MSVYKRKGAETFSYDFRLGGRRFLGETGERSKRKARTAEGIARAAAQRQIDELARLNAPQTWAEASSRWFNEIGVHHVQIEQTLASMVWLDREIGKGRPLTEINDNLVARLVAKRRLEKRSGKGWRSEAPISAATVNRTVTEPMRKVMLRAQRVWKVPVGDVTWSMHMLAEPKERVREASAGEESGIMGGLERGFEEAVAFAFRDACRAKEITGLKWTMVDFFSRQYTVLGKGGKLRTIPMSQATYDQLWRLRGQHDEFVFTFIAARTRPPLKQVRGKRYPIKPQRLGKVLKAAAIAAGVENFHLHDTRHTAATRVLRKSNLRVAQILLGHSDVKTTTKYAHALAEDVRAALDATSPAESPAAASGGKVKALRDLGKAG